ncbi:DUF4468 domain-containing protein [Deminuibacter soli]|uniref:DUF4468 domain-containing protein n=1 Tax=Deminuibacter soli TaxID=2291815 RepID=A0A3E1NQ78_9BACT|nr:DUF4468 domain-containing protein [Deminuibacter soli]RFM30070.1 DUF4468 domain-containing protein [Deminuibacter soli]
MNKLLFLALLIPVLSFSQRVELPLRDGHLIYEKVDSIPGKSMSEIFLSARQWVNDHFTQPKDNLQIDEKETGKLLGRYSFDTYVDKTLAIHNSVIVTIECKENKARVRLLSFDFIVDGAKEKRRVDEVIQEQQKSGIDIYSYENWGELDAAAKSILSGIFNALKIDDKF